MAGRLSNLRVVDPVLTNLAIGYSNADFVGEALFPFVEVEKERVKLPVFGKEAFKIYNTVRGLRADSNRINPEGLDAIDLATDEHDLEYPIDYREEAEAAFPLEAHATNVVTEGIRLRREKVIADLAQAPASYSASNRIALSGTSQFTDDASDPEGVVADGKAAIRAKIAKEPNTMVIGYTAWNALKRNKALRAVLGDNAKRLLRVEDLRDIFEIEHIAIGKGVYTADNGAFADLWADNIVLAYVAPRTGQGLARNVGEPSFGYTPRRKGNPQVDTYVASGGKLELVRATDNFRPYIVGADAGYLISDTNGSAAAEAV